jgi:hypothetical protein
MRYIDTRSTRLRLAALLEESLAAYNEIKDGSSQAEVELATTFSEFAQYSTVYFLHFWEQGAGDDLHGAIGKIEHELLTLRPLIEQRRRPHRGRGRATLAKIQRQIEVCDAIATDCIRRSVDTTVAKADNADKFCLTMFHDSTYVRIGRAAYKRTATIALPQSVWDEPWLWLGIAHEVGHYWFWNYDIEVGYSQNRPRATAKRVTFKERIESALLDDQELGREAAQLLQNLDRLARTQLAPAARVAPLAHWLDWAEELFADVFGALLLGPAYIQSLIFWLRPGLDRQSLLANDGRHPLAILRPLAQLEAIKLLLDHAEDYQAMVGGEPSLLDSQGHFDIPDLRDLWQSLCVEVAGCPFDELLSQPLGSFTVRNYVEVFMPAAVGIVVRLIQEVRRTNAQALRLYTRADHAQVRQAATTLAEGQRPEPTTAAALSPALSLCSAWYAWREITQEWVKRENGQPIFPGHPLRNTQERGRRLQTLRAWLADQSPLVGSQTTAPPWPISPGALRRLRGSQQVTQTALKVHDELFVQLVEELKVLYGGDPQVINWRLLQLEFSTQRREWVTIIDPNTGQWIRVWRPTVSDPHP